MIRNTALVSVIMPCYNAELYIELAITSVVNQSFKEWELLICDDNSSDESLQIARKWAEKDSRIKVISNKFDKGAPGARNSCLEEACGRYIAFLDSDDIWNNNKLETQISHMQKNGSCFSVSYYDVINEQGRHSHVIKTPREITFRGMMYSNFIPCLTAIYDSQTLGKVVQPNVKKRNDYALWLTLFREKGVVKATSVPDVLASYRQNDYGLSSSKVDALRYYFICLRNYGGRTRISSIYFSAAYLILTLIKKRTPMIYNLIITRFF